MARSKTDSQRVNIYMPRKLLAVTKKFANHRGLSYSEVMRTAITEYLRREINREKTS